MKYYLRELKAKNVQSQWDTNRTNIMLEDMYIERVFDEHELVVGYNSPEYEKDLNDEIYRELINQLSKELLKYVRFDKIKGCCDQLGVSNHYRMSLSLLSDEERQIYKSEIDELETYIDNQDEHLDMIEKENNTQLRDIALQFSLLRNTHSRLHISIALNILLLGLLIISFL